MELPHGGPRCESYLPCFPAVAENARRVTRIKRAQWSVSTTPPFTPPVAAMASLLAFLQFDANVHIDFFDEN